MNIKLPVCDFELTNNTNITNELVFCNITDVEIIIKDDVIYKIQEMLSTELDIESIKIKVDYNLYQGSNLMNNDYETYSTIYDVSFLYMRIDVKRNSIIDICLQTENNDYVCNGISL